MIVRDPVDCIRCDTTYCRICADENIKQNNKCPKKCSGNKILEIKDVNRLFKSLLSKARFKCNIA